MADRGGNKNPLSLDHSRLFCCVNFKKKRSSQKAGANAVEVRHISSAAGQGMSDPAAGISTLNGASLEGSAPLSHNSNGKAAVAISDVNDKQIIAQERGERIKVAL